MKYEKFSNIPCRMIPSFLVTLREVIEASLIVATILGILTKLNQTKGIRTVWMATGAASAVSMLLLAAGSIFGIKAQMIFIEKIEEIIEGTFMMLSAVFITWAVFFLHTYFARYKTRLLVKIKQTVEKKEQRALYWLVFTAVLREGFEIVLLLSTIFFSSNPKAIFTGFAGGLTVGILISLGFFAATLKLPMFYAFRTTSIFLIVFAARLLANGASELIGAGILPRLNFMQPIIFCAYTGFMTWCVFFRNKIVKSMVAADAKK